MHRYVAIGRRDAIEPAWKALSSWVDRVFPVEFEDVDAARRYLEADLALSARDALHVAVMKRHGVSRVLTFDQDFDRIKDLQRVVG
ncbi:MAG TPA: type II toxin-antitoxin system VapC family toxin [Thermoanaerobaculia bacterium]|nr:type II toxin-antitoxin system VapC family toxin [Thermoanaerobaculia bacterium]